MLLPLRLRCLARAKVIHEPLIITHAHFPEVTKLKEVCMLGKFLNELQGQGLAKLAVYLIMIIASAQRSLPTYSVHDQLGPRTPHARCDQLKCEHAKHFV